MLSLLSFVMFLLPLPSTSLTCVCRGYQECERFMEGGPAYKCTGRYCFHARLSADTNVYRQGCIDTLQDISTVPKCERNRRGSIFCICDTSNCNAGDEEVDDVRDLKPILCHLVNEHIDASMGRTCIAYACTQSAPMNVEEFGDIEQLPVSYGCAETSMYYDSSLRIMRGPLDLAEEYQFYMQTHATFVRAGSICTTNLCNKPAHIYVQMGNTLCYVFDGKETVGMCRGEICFTHSAEYATTIRGCISSSINSELFLQRNGESGYQFCNYNLCNGDSLESGSNGPKCEIVLVPLLFVSLATLGLANF